MKWTQDGFFPPSHRNKGGLICRLHFILANQVTPLGQAQWHLPASIASSSLRRAAKFARPADCHSIAAPSRCQGGWKMKVCFRPLCCEGGACCCFRVTGFFFFWKHRGYVSRASRAAEKDGGGVKDEREQGQGHHLEDYWARVDVFTATNVEKRIFS